MYKAIVQFTDLQDNNHKYLPGDVFPRAGLEVSEKRLEELATDKNRRHKPMIVKIEDKKPVKKEKPKEEIKADEIGMNPPEEPIEGETGTIEEELKPKRGRKKKDAE